MVPGGDPAFLDPDGTVKGVPSPASGGEQAAASIPLVLAPEAMDTAPPATGTTVPTAPAAALTAPAPGPTEAPTTPIPTPGR
jgi:hypothetical protein